MLTLAELSKLDINEKIAREAFAQTEKRLIDTLDTKKTFEQKATTLLGAFVTISLAVSGAGIAIFKSSTTLPNPWPVWVASILLFLGACCFAMALWDAEYGAVGSDPDLWLNAGTIDSTDDHRLNMMLAVITHHHKKRIDVGTRANIAKAKWIRVGVVLGAAAPLALVSAFFFD